MIHSSNTRGFVPALAALWTAVLLTGCGGGKAPILGGLGVDILPAPTVSAVFPAQGASAVALNTKVLTASFSKAMNPATLDASSFTLACPGTSAVTGNVTYTARTQTATLTLPTSANLPALTLCLAILTREIRDSDGLALAQPFSWNFTTSAAPDLTAPTVTATTPANGSNGVSLNTQSIVATFSEVMDAGTRVAVAGPGGGVQFAFCRRPDLGPGPSGA